MSDVRLTVSARSDVGRVRTNNEDAFNVTDLATGATLGAGRQMDTIDVHEKGVLLALSDGMGGHQAGEVASALVLESLRSAMQRGGANSIEAQIETAVRRANADVARAARTGKKRGMGATLTAIFVGGVSAYVTEVGDSRAYLLRSGRLRQITRDQSLVQMLVDKGLLSKEDAKISPHKNVILQAMGLAEDVRVAIARLLLRRRDRLLLCSDGLSNMLADEELREILGRGDVGTACAHLIERGNERGGEDNLTAIVAQVDGDGLAPPRGAESVTATFQVLKDFAEIEESALSSEKTPEPAEDLIPEPKIIPLGKTPGDKLPEEDRAPVHPRPRAPAPSAQTPRAAPERKAPDRQARKATVPARPFAGRVLLIAGALVIVVVVAWFVGRFIPG